MSDEERPHFHPISALPAIAIHISVWLQEVLETERLFGGAGPHQVDDATVQRTLGVYGEARGDVALFEEQLRRWRVGALSVGNRETVDHLGMQLARIDSAIESVRAEAERLRGGTIGSLSQKSDLELGLEVLEAVEDGAKPPWS